MNAGLGRCLFALLAVVTLSGCTTLPPVDDCDTECLTTDLGLEHSPIGPLQMVDCVASSLTAGVPSAWAEHLIPEGFEKRLFLAFDTLFLVDSYICPDFVMGNKSVGPGTLVTIQVGCRPDGTNPDHDPEVFNFLVGIYADNPAVRAYYRGQGVHAEVGKTEVRWDESPMGILAAWVTETPNGTWSYSGTTTARDGEIQVVDYLSWQNRDNLTIYRQSETMDILLMVENQDGIDSLAGAAVTFEGHERMHGVFEGVQTFEFRLRVFESKQVIHEVTN